MHRQKVVLLLSAALVGACMAGLVGGVIGSRLVAGRMGGDPRASLVQDIDAFEQWYNSDGDGQWQRARAHCSNPNSGNPYVNSGPSSDPLCQSYYEAQQRFLAQHPALNAYLAWLVGQRIAESRNMNSILANVHQNPTFAVMRDPQYLDRYLSTR